MTILEILQQTSDETPTSTSPDELDATPREISKRSNNRIITTDNKVCIESQRINGPLQCEVTNGNPATASRANISNVTSRRAPMLRCLPWFHSRDEMKIPVPTTSGRRKMSNLVATVLGVILIAFTIVVAKAVSREVNSDVVSQNNSTTSIPRKDDEMVESSSDAAEIDLVGKYNLHVCDQIDGDRELCTAGNCFTGPHCSCKMYFREAESNNVIGLCDSCQVCNFNGEIAFDCSNLGSYIQKCPPVVGGTEEKIEQVDYSPRDTYNERFCSLGLEPSTELCFAGECIDDESCRCNMYKQEVATGEIIGLCDSCSVCKSGSISSDCSNIGLTKVDCRDDNSAEDPRESDKQASIMNSLVEVDNDEYTERFCTQGFDPSTELCYAAECVDDERCHCYMYKREVATGEIIGMCNSCSICAAGGISSDCTNLYMSKVTCRTYDSNAASDSNTTPQLTQEQSHEIDGKLPYEELVNKTFDNSDETDIYSEDDYRCDGPNNGVQLCHAQSCEVCMLESLNQ